MRLATTPSPLSRPARSGRARGASGLATAAVLALALTGCGSESETEPAAPASSSSSAAESASPSPSESPSESASDAAVSRGDSEAKEDYLEAVRQAAEEDSSVRTRVISTVETPQGPLMTTVKGVTQMQDGKLSARLDTTLPPNAGGLTLQTLIVDGVFYLRTSSMPEGKYEKIELAQASGEIGAQLQQQLDQIDPRAQAEATVASVESVRVLGETKVNGVDVTQYNVTQDFQKFADAQENPLFDQLIQAGAAPQELESTVYLDEDGRVRRTQLELEVQGSAVRTVADFLAYDVDVSIEKPAKKDIVKSTLPSG